MFRVGRVEVEAGSVYMRDIPAQKYHANAQKYHAF